MHRALALVAVLAVSLPAAAHHDDRRMDPDERLARIEALLDDALRNRDLDRVRQARRQVAIVRADLQRVVVARPTMSPAALAAFHQELEGAWYDSNRLAILQNMKEGAVFTCDDVVAILGHFDIDSNRLEAVRLLQDVIVDPENRIVLMSAFDYDFNKRAAIELWSTASLAPPSPDRYTRR